MLDDELVERFVARNSGYYFDKWQRFHDKSGYVASFNFAACFGQIIWFVYRKLYVALGWTVLVFLGYGFVAFHIIENQLIPADLITVLAWIISFLFFFVIGAFGNYWYWKKFQKILIQSDSQQTGRETQLRNIQSKGGTNPVGAWVLIALMLIPIAWAQYQVSRVDYSDYIIGATGPLTLLEIQTNFLNQMEKPLTAEERECVLREVKELAQTAGDPESLDPSTVELLPNDNWDQLGPDGRRLVLTQAILTKAFFQCNNI